jgi:hypothetical protein
MNITITAGTLKKVGLRAIQLIRARTLRGVDVYDKSFKPYSTRAFVMPVGAVLKKALHKLKDDNEQAVIFTTKSGAKWILIKHGYKALREAMGRQTDVVNLSIKGAMLRGLTVGTVSTEQRTVQIMFTDADSALKAWYHNVGGAGKGKTFRQFLGLSRDDLQDATLRTFLQEGISVEI